MYAFPKLSAHVKDATVSQFSGLDTRNGAKDGSLKSQKNMSSMALPCLSTRFGTGAKRLSRRIFLIRPTF